MTEQKTGPSFVLGLLIAIGLIGLGYFVSNAFLKVKSLERNVAVKGLAQRIVKADTAIFPIRFEASENNLTLLNQKIKSDIEEIKTFLRSYGFSDGEITVSAPQITDKFAQDYGSNNIRFRYLSHTVMTLYSKQVDKVVNLNQDLFRLNEKGVIAKNDKYETKYLFSGLNDLKPQMIEDATKNAREAAAKFAKDSSSKLGKIKNAHQGYFSINARDSSTPYMKVVRVVTNVTYYLDD
ncbi:MAG: SIMPL domain-containing protein [Epsilonproteobacteria bacterium]|nr:SIMPL domain-containing protein [Campylobacterota bacterium]